MLESLYYFFTANHLHGLWVPQATFCLVFCLNSDEKSTGYTNFLNVRLSKRYFFYIHYAFALIPITLSMLLSSLGVTLKVDFITIVPILVAYATWWWLYAKALYRLFKFDATLEKQDPELKNPSGLLNSLFFIVYAPACVLYIVLFNVF